MEIRALKQYIETLKNSGISEFFCVQQNAKYVPEISAKQNTMDSVVQKSGLEVLKEEYKNCQKCELHRSRLKFVYGEGAPQARLMVIGEGPGADENVTGRPFVGKAGQLLTKMLLAIKINREEAYITNIVKCRPPNNREPNDGEISACKPYLLEQIEKIKPQVILLLGKTAALGLLGLTDALGKLREQEHFFQGIPVFITYHPSALLRHEEWKKPAWIDLQKLQKVYNSLEITQGRE